MNLFDLVQPGSSVSIRKACVFCGASIKSLNHFCNFNVYQRYILSRHINHARKAEHQRDVEISKFVQCMHVRNTNAHRSVDCVDEIECDVYHGPLPSNVVQKWCGYITQILKFPIRNEPCTENYTTIIQRALNESGHMANCDCKRCASSRLLGGVNGDDVLCSARSIQLKELCIQNLNGASSYSEFCRLVFYANLLKYINSVVFTGYVCVLETLGTDLYTAFMFQYRQPTHEYLEESSYC